jgi:hypothetical protein
MLVINKDFLYGGFSVSRAKENQLCLAGYV